MGVEGRCPQHAAVRRVPPFAAPQPEPGRMNDALEEIKRLYYSATRATISRDFDCAIDRLKTMATEEERERATVYMQGLAEMRGRWSRRAASEVGSAKSGSRARSKRG